MKNYSFFIFIVLLSYTNSKKHYNSNYNYDAHDMHMSNTNSLVQDPFCVNLSKHKANMRNITSQKYVESFIEGPCAPIVLIPGYSGTKLEFVMKNTTLFQESHEDIINACEWKNLKSPSLQKFDLWINTDIDFMSIAMQAKNDNEQNKAKIEEHIPKIVKKVIINDSKMEFEAKPKCFGALLRNYYSVDSQGNLKFEKLKGAIIKPKIENNRNTCGASSISNFLNDYSSYVKFTKGFDSIIKSLEKLGYKSGLSLFSFPYDWRLPPSEHIQSLNKTINLAYTINKKKSILIGHSYGGILAYNQVLKNKETVEHVISIGSPFLGTVNSLTDYFNDNTFYSYHKKFNAMFFEVEIETGIHRESAKLLSASTANRFTFFPKPKLNDDIDENIQDVLSDLFPKEEEVDKCKQTIEYLDRKTVCQVPSTDFYSHALFTLNSEYNRNDIYTHYEKELFEVINSHKYFNEEDVLNFEQDYHNDSKYNIPELLYQKYMIDQKEEIYKFKDPEVPYTFIYGNHLPMISRIELKNKGDKIEISKIEKTSPGDGTVDTLSQIYPGLRWLSGRYYTNNKESNVNEKNDNPIHFVEYCASSNKSKLSKKYDHDKNQYITLPCECLKDKTKSPIESCNHSTIINDEYIIILIEKIIKSKKSEKVLVNESYINLYEKVFNNKLHCYNLFK